MIPILLLGIGGLTLLALSRGVSAQPIPKAKPDDKEAAKRRYAQSLLSYVNKGGKSRSKIKSLQRRIGAKRTGKPDTQTEKKIESILGYDVSWRPKRKVVKPKVFTRIPEPRVTVPPKKKVVMVPESDPLREILRTLEGKPTPKPSVRKPPTRVKPAPVRKPKPITPKLLPATTTRAPRFTAIPPAVPDSVIAATALDAYLRSGGLARTRVKEYQRRMGGGLAIDGVPGPKTKARAETLLKRSVSWPAQNAAEDLRNYYRNGGRNRTKIKAFQNAMGELTVDGLVGPATKRRYKALTGKIF